MSGRQIKAWVAIFAALMMALAPPTIFHDAKSLGDGRRRAEFMAYLWQEVSPRWPIRVLDAGCGMGYFIPRIRSILENYGYTVTVEGLDSMEAFFSRKWTERLAPDSRREGDEEFIHDLEEARQCKIWYADIAKAHNVIQHRFDFIFINAPYPYTRASDEGFMEGSFKLLKDTGVLFLRFHWEETQLARVNWIREMCQKNGYEIVMRNTQGLIPQGMFPLDEEYTFIIKKTHFANPDSVVASSLGKLAEEIFAIKQTQGAA